MGTGRWASATPSRSSVAQGTRSARSCRSRVAGLGYPNRRARSRWLHLAVGRQSMRILFPTFLLVAATVSAAILEESSRSLGRGFREVTRSESLPAGSFEGVGHFAFVYFGDTKLCQCTASDLFVSPSGSFAVFIDGPSGKVMLFTVQSKAVSSITPSFVGLVAAVSWNEASNLATVQFRAADANGTPPMPMTISLLSAHV